MKAQPAVMTPEEEDRILRLKKFTRGVCSVPALGGFLCGLWVWLQPDMNSAPKAFLVICVIVAAILEMLLLICLALMPTTDIERRYGPQG